MKIIQTDDFPNTFYVLVEISMGSNCKYEYNEEIESIILDRVLFTPMKYPANYGMIFKTEGKDGDPLDVLLISSSAIQPGILVKCRAVGLAEMRDEEGIDDKVIAVPVNEVDPNSESIRDIEDVPQYQKNIFKHFFEHYKELEKGKFMKFLGFKDKKVAVDLILDSIRE
ncbi:MAG: inorganic diphosphatase [Thermoplasmatales archaeon]